MEKNELRAVELVRRIRDDQPVILAGKSEAEVLEFVRKAGDAARQRAADRARGVKRTA